MGPIYEGRPQDGVGCMAQGGRLYPKPETQNPEPKP